MGLLGRSQQKPPFLAHSWAADPHSMLLMAHVTPPLSSWRCVVNIWEGWSLRRPTTPLLRRPPCCSSPYHSAVKGSGWVEEPSGQGLGVVSGNTSLWGYLLWDGGS